MAGVLTDTLIPMVYEDLGLSATSNARVEPAGGNTRVTRLINDRYRQWARETCCFRRTATINVSAATADGLYALPDDLYRIISNGVRLSTPSTIPVTRYTREDIYAEYPDFRATLPQDSPYGWYLWDSRYLAFWPALVLLKGTWSGATAYAVRDLVARSAAPTVFYRCLVANTAIEPTVTTDWATYWVLESRTINLEAHVVPNGTTTPPTGGLGLLVASSNETPAFNSMYHNALAHGAAADLARLYLADDVAVGQRGMAAEAAYQEMRQEFALFCANQI